MRINAFLGNVIVSYYRIAGKENRNMIIKKWQLLDIVVIFLILDEKCRF